ncbi:response regulator [Dactylosporangium sp. AC04546]|uniref:ATP-binding response regulator n=1 Tax=Dactylosporangium sp. AC04546 TaxID=2862460 RepID=UPI002E7B7A85|nr:response regulator [Dactylosporangium sp. AC04546]WVK83703.1 response regulator [Dactylosporangium sp. AC04546]
MQRDITLIFLPTLLVCGNGVYRDLMGRPVPALVGAVATAMLLLQPYFTLRLTARLRRVPRWITRTLLVLLLASAAVVSAAPRPLSLGYLIAVTTTFTITEVLAGTFLLHGSRRRSGAARVRLRLAAAATYCYAVMMLTLFLGAVQHPGVTNWLSTSARVVGLVSAGLYLLAFVPPAWLRRFMSATVWYEATEDLQRLPADVGTGQVWRRYVQVVHETTGTDVVLLLDASLDRVAGVCRSGTALPHERLTGFTLAELTAGGRPVDLPRDHPLAEATGARVATVLPLRDHRALLLLDRYRALFTTDDLRLAGVLGGQARLLAERSEIMAEQRRLAERLAESVDALTHASQAKSDFLAGMSHELRTPLNAIIGFSDLMRAEQPDGDRRSVPAEWVDHVHSSGRHLLGLINDILDLAKVEAGRLELHPVPLPMDTVVGELVDGLRPLTDKKGLQVYLDVPAIAVRADPLRFRQILDNLLSNAIKFTSDGGLVAVSATAAGDQVAVTVADSGIGIAPADQERVFEEFQQVGPAAQRNAGTGLGLALTRRLVEAHGGTIELASALGEGSRFTVRLPAAVPAPSPIRSVEPPGPTRGRVLIVDDDPRAAELLLTYLATAGYHVRVAPSGEAGLTAAQDWHPDAILLDVIMPGLDGWDVIRELKGSAVLRDIPVFFATIIDDRRAGLSLGAADFFVKPVDHGALLAQLARHIAPADSATVLVVDRDDHTRAVVEQQLRDGGIDVVTCNDGPEGLRLSRDRRFDLIICDLEMPDVDGFALLSGLEVDPATRGIPVLALTEPDLSDADRRRLTGKVIGTVPRSAAASDGLREWIDLAAVASSLSEARAPQEGAPT